METSRIESELTFIRRDMDELVKIAQRLLKVGEQNDPDPIEPSGMCLKQDFWPNAIKNLSGRSNNES